MPFDNSPPSSLAELLPRALDGLRQVEQDPGFAVDMDSWWRLDPKTDLIHVCLGGALAYQMGERRRIPLTQFTFNMNGNWLNACDMLTWGRFDRAYQDFYGHPRVGQRTPENITVTRYHDDRPGFFRDMEAVQSILEREGL